MITGILVVIGFTVKPFFLLPWLLIEIGRKPFRTGQLTLVVMEILYAIPCSYSPLLLYFTRPRYGRSIQWIQ
ncbi:hypothetical protein MSKU9_2508 [Komagataeibacter diospyri]|uniref:Uncharacterized protein n=1 Tax=Komagataeibacter diospyri TaxID=1932662 RepID=A0A4P5NVH9_9PROT|nr:hypothetical protein MSKU9_2508 [Komagataeibacter diospyri]